MNWISRLERKYGRFCIPNLISIIVPCHRVVGSDGSLTGYAGGIDKKMRLLTLENAEAANLYR